MAAKPLCDLFVELRKCVFPASKDLLGIFIAHLTLRYVKPACEIEKAWTEEDLGAYFHFIVLKDGVLLVGMTKLISLSK